jgi:hypothetical protein
VGPGLTCDICVDTPGQLPQAGHRPGRRDEHRRLGLAGIAGLYRTDARARPLTQALTRAGLSFQKRSHDRVARRSRVAGIVGELRRMAGGDDVAAGGRGGARPGRGARERDTTVAGVRAAGCCCYCWPADRQLHLL